MSYSIFATPATHVLLFGAAAAIIPIITFITLAELSSPTKEIDKEDANVVKSYYKHTADLGNKVTFVAGCMALGFVMSGYLKHDPYTIAIAAPVLLTTMLCSQICLLEGSGDVKSSVQCRDIAILGAILGCIGAAYSSHYCK